MNGHIDRISYDFDIYLKNKNNKKSTLSTVNIDSVVQLLDKLEPFQTPKMDYVSKQKFKIAGAYRFYQWHCLN